MRRITRRAPIKSEKRITEQDVMNICGRHERFYEHYDSHGLTVRQVLSLSVTSRRNIALPLISTLSKSNSLLAAADITESALYIFDDALPGDNRTRECVEGIRAFVGGKIDRASLNELQLGAFRAEGEARTACMHGGICSSSLVGRAVMFATVGDVVGVARTICGVFGNTSARWEEIIWIACVYHKAEEIKEAADAKD